MCQFIPPLVRLFPQAAKAEIVTIVLEMELALQVRVEELPERLYLATSDELPGLVAQGRTVAEALDIARDVARRIIEARSEREGPIPLASVSDRRDSSC